MSGHQFPARDGVGTVRANFPRTPAQIAAAEQKRQQSEIIIAEHRAAMEAREQARLKIAAAAINPRTACGPWTQHQIADLRHLRNVLKFTDKQIASHFGISYCAAKSAIDRHLNPETIIRRRASRSAATAAKSAAGEVQQWRETRKAEARKPTVEAAIVNEKIERFCSTCGKAFLAPTRFVRRCKTHTIGGSH